MVSWLQKVECVYSGLLNQTVCLWYKRGLVQSLVGNHQWKVFLYKWHGFLTGVACICEGETMVNDNWLKLRWMTSVFFFNEENKKDGAWQLNMLHSACTKFAEHLLRFRSYTCQLLQCVTAQDIFLAVLSELTTDFKDKIVPSDEATLHMSRHVNRCNFRMLEQPSAWSDWSYKEPSEVLRLICSVQTECLGLCFLLNILIGLWLDISSL
jgi:hypothetical protein